MKSARQADPVASAHSGPPHPQSGQGSNLQRPKVPPSSMPRRQRPSVKGCLEPAALPPPRLDCSERSGIRLNFASSQSGAFCERAARGHSTRVAATRPRPPLRGLVRRISKVVTSFPHGLAPPSRALPEGVTSFVRRRSRPSRGAGAPVLGLAWPPRPTSQSLGRLAAAPRRI